MPSNLRAAAEMASDLVGNASAELTDTPFAYVTVAWKPLPFGVALKVICVMPWLLRQGPELDAAYASPFALPMLILGWTAAPWRSWLTTLQIPPDNDWILTRISIANWGTREHTVRSGAAFDFGLCSM